MDGPSSGVSTDLVSSSRKTVEITVLTVWHQIQHLHLLSNYQLPRVNNPSLEFLVEQLRKAPRIFSAASTVSWQILDSPTEFMAFAWQPPQLHNRFATDGYLWADPEQHFRQELHGYVSPLARFSE